MSTTAKKMGVRDIAREKIAAQREAARQREAANEKSIVAFLTALSVAGGAAAKRDKAIAKAEATYRSAVADAETTMHAVIAEMRERGETIAEIAGLTDLSESDVRRHIAAHKADTTGSEEDATATGEAAGSEPTGRYETSEAVVESAGEREALGDRSVDQSLSQPVGEPVSVGSF